MQFQIDQKFVDYFSGRLKQVFLYITDDCDLRCHQCIYKPSVTSPSGKTIPAITIAKLLTDFRQLGATKVTFLGGEPTLYGVEEGNKPLFDSIRHAIDDIGFKFVRLDTNGQFKSSILEHDDFQKLHELAFSLDGYTAEMNDSLRGCGVFQKCIMNIRLAVRLGYRVTITCCLQKSLVSREDDGVPRLHKMIKFAEQIGVSAINFHDLFKVGVPMDSWTGEFDPTVEEWVEIYDDIRCRMNRGEYAINVRLPQCFVKRSEFDNNMTYYGFCPVKLGERVMVHSDGIIRICSNLICTRLGIARYSDTRIEWLSGDMNELSDHDLKTCTPCTNRGKHKRYGQFVPLCFSFKPLQEEFVWQNNLSWDKLLGSSSYTGQMVPDIVLEGKRAHNMTDGVLS